MFLSSTKSEDAPNPPPRVGSTQATRVCWGCFSNYDPIFSVYLLLSLSQIVMFAETGAVPALLVDLTGDFKLTFPQQGYLGGIVYIGIALGAPFTFVLFSMFSTRKVLILTLSLNALTVLLFGMTPAKNGTLLIALRGLLGFTQATLSVFCPVWVDRFATKKNATKWFSWLQITVPLGIMFGYILGWGAVGLKTAAGEGQSCFGNTLACWRIPFFFQALISIPLCISFSTISDSQLSITQDDEKNDQEKRKIVDTNTTSTGNYCSGCCTHISDTCADVYEIVSQFYFTSVVFVITTMYFVLMSIQYWATDWMVVGRKYNEHKVMGWFIFSSATAPIFGAILGGILIDRIGGYRGSVKQRSLTTGVLFLIYCVGVVCGLAATAWPGGGLPFAVMCLWLVLFCGGMAVPALTGMYTAAIPSSRLKLLGSSIMLIITSLFAYALCPIIAGYLMRSFSTSITGCRGKVPGTCPEALEKGFTWSMYMGPISLLMLLTVWIGGCFLSGDRLMGVDVTSSSDSDIVEKVNDVDGKEEVNEHSPLLSKSGGRSDIDRSVGATVL